MSQQLSEYHDIISESIEIKNKIQPQITRIEERISLLENKLKQKNQKKIIDIDEEIKNIDPIQKVLKDDDDNSEQDNIRSKLQHLADSMEKIKKLK